MNEGRHGRLIETIARNGDVVYTTQGSYPGVEPLYRGKVREMYDLGDELLEIATDRLSAFDVVMREPVPTKGLVLASMTEFWNGFLADVVPNDFISSDFSTFPEPFRSDPRLDGRAHRVQKHQIARVECIARGNLTGSGLKDYKRTGSICGIELPNWVA